MNRLDRTGQVWQTDGATFLVYAPGDPWSTDSATKHNALCLDDPKDRWTAGAPTPMIEHDVHPWDSVPYMTRIA